MTENMETTTNVSNEECAASDLGLFNLTSDHAIAFMEGSARIMLTLSLASAILQLYVLKHAIRHIMRHTSDQCLHIFLFSMTLGDFLLTGFTQPVELVQILLTKAELPLQINLLAHWVAWIALLASSLSLVLLNVDKLTYFKMPLVYPQYVTRSRALLAIIATWVACAIFVALCWASGAFHCEDDRCAQLRMFAEMKILYLMFSIFVCIMPAVSSFAVACYILHVVGAHKKQLAEEQALCNGGSHSSTSSHVMISRLKTFYFIFMSTVVTVVTLLPLRTYVLYLKFIVDEEGLSPCLRTVFLWIMTYMLQLNSIVNPILTVTILPQYRCQLFKRFCKRDTERHTRATEV